MQSPYPYEDKRYCSGCKKKHSITIRSGWDCWGSDTVRGKKVYFCKDYFFCIGCNSVHKKTSYMENKTMTHPETGEKLNGWWCEKWVKPAPPSMDKIIANLSPQEVVSGVQYGLERQDMWGEDTEDFSVERAKQLPELEEALSE